MTVIANKIYQLSDNTSKDVMGALLHDPRRLLENITPSLPSYIRLREVKIVGNRIAADFSSSYYPIRLEGLFSFHTEILGDDVLSGIEIDVEGGTPAKDRVFRNISKISLDLAFSSKSKRLSIRISYLKGAKPSFLPLHVRALGVVSKQTRSLARVIQKLSSSATSPPFPAH